MWILDKFVKNSKISSPPFEKTCHWLEEPIYVIIFPNIYDFEMTLA